jgi:hypothetical protein
MTPAAGREAVNAGVLVCAGGLEDSRRASWLPTGRSPTARARMPSADSRSWTCPHARRRWNGRPRSPSPAAACGRPPGRGRSALDLAAFFLLQPGYCGRILGVVDGLDRRPEIDRPVEAAAVSEDTSRDSETNVVVEKRTRREAHADLRQAAESGWDRSFKFDPPREELALFRPEKAGLNSVSIGEAVRYIEQNRDSRPWLQTVERSCPETRWIFAAADLSGAHWPVRHEGWVSEERSMRRVAYLEDPAQLDPGKRQAGIDGLLPRDRHHVCADRSTRITNPDACATALVRGTRHPAVQAALAMPFDRKYRQQPVWLPIADLLGKDGHKVCTGWQLQPEGGSTNEAMENQRAWRTALAEGRPPNGPEPRALPVPTFEGGTIAFIISQNRQRTGYKIASLVPQPPD